MKYSPFLLLIFATTWAGVLTFPPEARWEPSVCRTGRSFVQPTEEQIKKFAYDPKHPKAGPYFQGDISGVIPDDLIRNGITGDEYRWPDNTVVYSVDGNFGQPELDSIQEAMDKITEATDGCISFRQKSSDDEYHVSIINDGSGCHSALGYAKEHSEENYQVLNLDIDGCFTSLEGETPIWGTAAHELIHAIGFFHEQARTDRDKNITVIWENIQDENWDQFCIQRNTDTYGQPYDYDSIMHYADEAFTKRAGLKTMIPRKKGVHIGQEDHISKIDAIKMKKMYHCE